MGEVLIVISESYRLRERLLALAPGLRAPWERLRGSPVGYRLAKGAFWSLAGTAISRGLQLLGTILVARMLGKETYGELGIIQSTVGMFGVFAGFGMGLTATKHVAEYRDNDPERAGRIIVLTEMVTVGVSLLVLLALAFSAHFLASHTLAAPELAPLLMVGGLLLPFSALNGAQTGALSGLEAFRTIAKVNLLSGLLSFPFLVCGAYARGITGALIGLILSQIVNCVMNRIALRTETARFGIQLRIGGSAQERKVLWDFSLPTVFANLVGWGAGWGCSAILVNQISGYAEMGVVSAGNHWRAALMFLPVTLLNAMLPMLASENPKTPTDFARTLDLAHKLIGLLVMPITLILMLAAGWILSLYGHGFVDGRAALVYMLAGTSISAVSSPASSAIIAKGKMRFALVLNLLNAIVFVSITWWLAPSKGAEGLSIAFLAGNFIQALAGYTYLRPMLPAGMFARNLVAILFLCLAPVLILCL